MSDCPHNPGSPGNLLPQQMALAAILKRDDNLPVPCRDLVRVESEKGKAHLDSFYIWRVVALMAVDPLVGALGPL